MIYYGHKKKAIKSDLNWSFVETVFDPFYSMFWVIWSLNPLNFFYLLLLFLKSAQVCVLGPSMDYYRGGTRSGASSKFIQSRCSLETSALPQLHRCVLTYGTPLKSNTWRVCPFRSGEAYSLRTGSSFPQRMEPHLWILYTHCHSCPPPAAPLKSVSDMFVVPPNLWCWRHPQVWLERPIISRSNKKRWTRAPCTRVFTLRCALRAIYRWQSAWCCVQRQPEIKH